MLEVVVQKQTRQVSLSRKRCNLSEANVSYVLLTQLSGTSKLFSEK